MEARFRSILVVAIILVVAFVFVAYRFGWSGTGFLNKTLWDWLQLLIIPLALAVVALLFQLANTRTDRQIAQQRYVQDQQIILDKQHEDLLQAYLDRMSELLLKEKLRSSEDDAEVRNVARVRTITVLTQLDARRIGYVFTFLREAGLLSKKPVSSVVSLNGADLSAVNWGQAYLYKAKLSGANLSSADLSGANLSSADLSYAYLYKANFSRAKLINATLNDAVLNGADFSGAIITEEQLKQAKSLAGATMPDGSIHE
jgi:uncharacterized protein YjbI with pentapeptide repeats